MILRNSPSRLASTKSQTAPAQARIAPTRWVQALKRSPRYIFFVPEQSAGSNAPGLCRKISYLTSIFDPQNANAGSGHHLGCLELGDLLGAVAQFRQYFSGVRAESRSDMPGRRQAAGEFDRAGDLRLRAITCTRHLGDQATGLDLWVLDRFAEVEHGLHAGIQFGEHLAPLS